MGGSLFAKRWPWLLLVVSLVFNLGVVVAVAARGCLHWCGQDTSKPSACLDDTLKLTPGQRQKAAAARDQLLNDARGLQRQIDAERLGLAEQLAADTPDRSDIQARVEKIADLQKQLQLRVVDHMLSGKEGLNAEQLQIYHQILRRCVCAGCPQADRCCEPGHGEAPHSTESESIQIPK